MTKNYDLVIIGGGIGGYTAAIRASQLGLKTAIVEKSKLGGTCLHKGCIPTKALLRSAQIYALTKHKAESFGVLTGEVTLDFEKVQQRQNTIVEQLHRGVQGLMKKGKIDVYEGIGRILGPSIFSPIPGTISVELGHGLENEMLLPKSIIIATGSRPRTLNGLELDGEWICSSEELLNLTTLPKSIVIVGGGVIGVEWASMLNDFGVKVTILENAPSILPMEDEDISKELKKLLTDRGVHVVTSAKVVADQVTIKEGVSVTALVDGEEQVFEAEKMLISIGRQANVENIGLENTDIKIEKGSIAVNAHYQTKEKHIYAIGDVIGGLQLAHVAAYEGIRAVEHIVGKPMLEGTPQFPRCVYGTPEVASIGLTAAQAKEAGIPVSVAKFPFNAIGKAKVLGQTEGFMKVIANAKNNDLVGVHMIGPHVTDLISEASLAMVLDATPWEIAHTVHPHPTLSEIFGETALAVDGEAIHL